FDTVPMLRRRQERDESADRKIGIPHRVAAGIQDVASRERDSYDERQQTLVHFPRQTGEESIPGGHHASWSANAGRYRKSAGIGRRQCRAISGPAHGTRSALTLRTPVGIADVIVATGSTWPPFMHIAHCTTLRSAPSS